MKDFRPEAEALFRDFARRHSFVIERTSEPDDELFMRVPRQSGLSFDITLGLQNSDELNIGFEEFWSYFFPFEDRRQRVADLLDGLATGECRLATHRQFGFVAKQVLEHRRDGQWRTAYTAYNLRVPFLGTKVTYLYNDDARPAGKKG